MVGTIQNYTLDMADGTAPKPLIVKQGDTNSRQARISLKAFDQPWTIPFGCQIQINVRKNDGTYANATCNQEDEHTVLAPITEQMAAVSGTHLGELFFLGSDGDIRSQTFPLVAWDAVTDLNLMESVNDFQALKDALRDVKISTDAAAIATQYATEQGNSARDMAQRAENAAESLQQSIDSAAAAKVSETNAKTSETAAAQTQQAVTDYVESQKAAFVGYSKRESDSKYANAIIKTASGEGRVTVEDAWTAPVLALDVAGKSEQVVTTGAQLWSSGDVSGTTQTRVNIDLAPGTYTLTADITSSDIESDQCLLYNVSQNVELGCLKRGVKQSLAFTLDDQLSIISFYASTKYAPSQGDTFEFKNIMLNAGDTPKPWEPYTGGAPSPRPDYPQDIISTGTVSTGAQLLKESYVTKSINGLTFTVNNDESFSIAGTATASTSINLIDDSSIIQSCFSRGGKYYFSLLNANYNASTCNISIGYANGSTETKFFLPEGMKELPTNTEFKGCTLWINSGVTINLSHVKLMLNAGNTPLPWEPYTGGKPAPSVEYPQTLEVQATGKNLFDTDNYVDFMVSKHNGASNIINKKVFEGRECLYINGAVNSPDTILLSCLPEQIYTISYDVYVVKTTETASANGFAFRKQSGVPSYVLPTYAQTGKWTKITGTTSTGCLYVYPTYGAKSEQYIDLESIQVEIGSTATPWEPYHSATAPVTLTEPLRGIGDYRDRIMCRGGVWGIERWIEEIDNAQWRMTNIASGTSGHRFLYAPSGMISISNCNTLCSKYKKRSASSFTVEGDYISTDEAGLIHIRTLNPGFETIEDFKAHMADAVTLYPIATPTWTPLPDATQQALNELTTYAGTTHLTITAGGTTPTVTLDYVQDTHKAFEQHDTAVKQYVDDQIAAIVAALPTATQAAIADNQTTRLLQEV